MPRPLPVLAAVVLLLPGMALAQTAPASPAPVITPPASRSEPPVLTPAAPAQPASGSAAPGAGKPTAAQQAVLDRIRRLRDGDQRRFGSCSYRWDRWKLQPDGSRTTSYSCEGSPPIVDHTVGVNCSKLQINSFNPSTERTSTGERGSWGSWRLPEPGGEEQMVATLCANALPMPTAVPPANGKGAISPAAGAASRTASPPGASPASGR